MKSRNAGISLAMNIALSLNPMTSGEVFFAKNILSGTSMSIAMMANVPRSTEMAFLNAV